MGAIIAIIIVIVILGGVFWVWLKFSDVIIKRRDKFNSEKHFINKILSKTNNDEIKKEIEKSKDTEFNKKPINIFITKNFLITNRNEIIPLKEILWVYSTVLNVKSLSTSNTFGTQVKLNIVLDNGTKKTYNEKDQFVANEIISEILKNSPWIITGYTKELEKQIKSNLKKYVENKNLQISKKD